jgi:hypothetical protein
MTEIKADAYARSYGPALMVKAFIDFLRNGDPTALLPGPDGRLERKRRSSRMRPGRS